MYLKSIAVESSLTFSSHTRINSTLRLSSTSLRSLPQSAPVTTCRRQTRSSGSISLHYTRTPTKASKDAARTGGYLRCRPQLQPIPHPTRQCLWHLCIEAFLDPTNKTVVTVAAAAHQCPRTQATTDLSTTTTSTLQSRPVTKHKAQVTMTWSSPSERCINRHAYVFACKKNAVDRELGMAIGVLGCRPAITIDTVPKLVQRRYTSPTFLRLRRRSGRQGIMLLSLHIFTVAQDHTHVLFMLPYSTPMFPDHVGEAWDPTSCWRLHNHFLNRLAKNVPIPYKDLVHRLTVQPT